MRISWPILFRSCFISFCAVVVCSAHSETARQFQKVPPEVLAFYYPWYGAPKIHGHWVHWGKVNPETHDISDSTHYPAQGAYDSHDPGIVEHQIALAQASGITGFIHSWWEQNTFEGKQLPILLEAAAKKNFKVSVYWEVAPGKEETQIDRAVTDLVFLLTHYATNSAFLKVEGKPVMFVYGRVMQQVKEDSWSQIIGRARAKAGDFLLIADGYQAKNAAKFDGLHTYNICSEVKGKSPADLRAWASRHYQHAISLAHQNHRIACVTVIPGYDDTKIRKPGLKADRQEGQVYQVLWEEAIRANPDWILITSWNEWHEGSEIEPSLEFGDKYLTLTKEYTRQFRAH